MCEIFVEDFVSESFGSAKVGETFENFFERVPKYEYFFFFCHVDDNKFTEFQKNCRVCEKFVEDLVRKSFGSAAVGESLRIFLNVF